MKTSIASTQYQLGAAELEVLLAMVRTGTLAAAGARLGVDAGTVRTSSTDTLVHGLIAPALQVLQPRHPALVYELHAGNELVSLTRRDTDIAVRATKRPPQHLVGRQLGMIRSALYADTASPLVLSDVEAGRAAWIAPDDALPDHPSVRWRKKRYPKAQPTYRVNSLLTVMELVALGMGVGVLPLFLAQGRSDLRPLTGSLADCETELWLLTHPESRHLRRIATVYGHLAETVQLP